MSDIVKHGPIHLIEHASVGSARLSLTCITSFIDAYIYDNINARWASMIILVQDVVVPVKFVIEYETLFSWLGKNI